MSDERKKISELVSEAAKTLAGGVGYEAASQALEDRLLELSFNEMDAAADRAEERAEREGVTPEDASILRRRAERLRYHAASLMKYPILARVDGNVLVLALQDSIEAHAATLNELAELRWRMEGLEK